MPIPGIPAAAAATSKAGGGVKRAADALTGGKGNFGEFNRQRMLWGGRAKAKRLENRVAQLENNELFDEMDPDEIVDTLEDSAKLNDKMENLLNPLNVKNVTVTQIQAGNSKKDILYARRMTEINTKLLKTFTKATVDIANNTKVIKKQNTDIKKDKKKPSKIGKFASMGKKSKETSGDEGGLIATIMGLLEEYGGMFAAALGAAGLIGAAKKIRTGARNRKAKKLKNQRKARDAKSKNKPKNQPKSQTKSQTKNKPRKTKPTKGNMNTRKKFSQPTKKGSKVKGIKALFQKAMSKIPKGAFKFLSKGFIRGFFVKAAAMAGATLASGAVLMLAEAVMVASIGYAVYEATSWLLVQVGYMTPEDIENAEEAAGLWYDLGVMYVKDFAKSAKEFFTGSPLEIELAKSGNLADALRAKLHILDKTMRSGIVTAKTKQEFVSTKRELSKEISIYNRLAKLLDLGDYMSSIKDDGKGSYSTIANMFTSENDIKLEQMWLKRMLTKKKPTGVFNAIKKPGVSIANTNTHAPSKVKYEIDKDTGTFKPKNMQYLPTKFTGLAGAASGGLTGARGNLMGNFGQPFVMNIQGLADAYWSGLTVDPSFRKFIDINETGGKADYMTKGGSSSAFGRYQFMPKTARYYCNKIGISFDNWKIPENQDRLFQALVDDNTRMIKSRGLTPDLMTLWVAHNLGPGSLRYMFGDNNSNYGKKASSFTAIKGQIPGTHPQNIDQARQIYMAKYQSRAAAMANGKVSPYDAGLNSTRTSVSKTSSSGTGGYGSSTGQPGASGAGGAGGTSYANVMQKFENTALKSNNFNSLKGYAEQFVGRMYSQKARGISGSAVLATSNSYDCSSLCALFAQDIYGIPMNKFGWNTEQQLVYLRNNKHASKVNGYGAIEAGDFIIYNYDNDGHASHIAMAISKTERVHASGSKKGVIIGPVNGGQGGLVGIFRINPNNADKNTTKGNVGSFSSLKQGSTTTGNQPTAGITPGIRNIMNNTTTGNNNNQTVNIFNTSQQNNNQFRIQSHYETYINN